MNIQEALTPHQAREADEWADEGNYPHTHDLVSKHVMKGEHTIILPLHEDGESTQPHPAVESHLSAHGYKISDYKAGYAVEPKNSRIVRIGKALNATKAPDHVVKAFNNDPNRMVKDDTNVEVAITHHPHQIAGMSTGRGWKSCLNMVDGSNRHYLPEEIKNGTHAAYLIHKGDHDIERPIARIALKHFASDKPSSMAVSESVPGHDEKGHHHVLYPEQSSYGSGEGGITTRFEKTVQHWTDKHFPMMEDRIYKRSGDTHDDNLGNEITPIGEKMIRKHLDRGDNPLRHADPHTVRQHHVEYALDYLRSQNSDYPHRDDLRGQILHSAADEHLSHATVNREYMFDKANGALNSTSDSVHHRNTIMPIATTHSLLKKLSSENTNELLDHYSKLPDANPEALARLVNSPKVSAEKREAVTMKPDGKANFSLVTHPDHVTPKIAEGVMKALKPAMDMKIPLGALAAYGGSGGGNLLYALKSPHFTGEHLHQLIPNTKDHWELHNLAKNPNFGPEHHNQVINHFVARAQNSEIHERERDNSLRVTKTYLSDSPRTSIADVTRTLGHLSPEGQKNHMGFFVANPPNKEVLEHALTHTVTGPHNGNDTMIGHDAFEHFKNSNLGTHYLATRSFPMNVHGDEDLTEKLITHDARAHDIPGDVTPKDDQVRKAGMHAERAIKNANFDAPRWDRTIDTLLNNKMYIRAGAAIQRKYAQGHGVTDEHFEKMRSYNPRFSASGV